MKREVDKALNDISFKDIDALNVDENKTKLKIRKIIADVKGYAEKSPITVNIEFKKNKLNNDLTAYLNRNTKISESSVLLKEAERVRELINAIGDKKTLREATDAAYKYGGSIEKLSAALDGANYISNKNSATLTDIADATRVSASFAANAGVAIDEL